MFYITWPFYTMVNKFIELATKRIKRKEQVAEIDIETPFVKYCKRNGCRALKLIILNKRGFPDRTVLCPGSRVIFFEFKRKGKKQSGAQLIIMKLITSLDFEYHVCDEKGQAESILDDFLL